LFDPYRKWLGILPKDQPPNHYRLLGVELFEDDLDVIEGAADRQMGFVRQYQSGEHAVDAARILNELALARICLLKPAMKSAYDARLRTQLAPVKPEFPQGPLSFEDTQPGPRSTASKKKKRTPTRAIPPQLLIGAGAGGLFLIVVAVFAMTRGQSRPAPQPSETPNPVVATGNSANNDSTTKPAIATPSLTNNSSSDSILWQDSPLVTEPAGQPVDLLKLIDMTRDVISGRWQLRNGVLTSSEQGRLYLPANLPDDYQLKLSTRRLNGVEGLAIGFVVGGRQGMLVVDGWSGTSSGLYVDGRDNRSNCTATAGKKLGTAVNDIVLTVHPGHVHAACGGKTFVDWHGAPERSLVDSWFGMVNRQQPFLCLTTSKFEFDSASLIPLKSEPPLKPPVRLDHEVDLLPMIDTDRDIHYGIWAVSKSTLSSPDGWGKIYLPTVVPEEYTISMTVERPANAPADYSLGLGVIAQNSYCQISSTTEASGIDMIDGRRWNNNETRLQGPLLNPGVPVRIAYTVTKSGIRMEADGRLVINWRGDPRRLSLPAEWAFPDGRRLYLGAVRHLKFRDLKIGPPIDPPKLPAHPPISVGKPLNLLTLIDPARDAYGGTWERDGLSLRCRGDAEQNRLSIPVDVPVEYKLSMQLARTDEGSRKNECLYVGLPFGSSKTFINIDGFGSTGGGLRLDLGPGRGYRGPVIPASGSRNLTFLVRKTGLQVMSEGKALIDWSGNPERASYELGAITPGRLLSLGSWHQGFRFEKLELEPLPPTSFPVVPSQAVDGKLLPLLNVQRDARRGDWKLDENGLTCPASNESRLRIPVKVPTRYVFSAIVERKGTVGDVLIGLVVGGHPCTVDIDGDGGSRSGIDLLDARRFNDNLNVTCRKHGAPLLAEGQKVAVRCFVLPDTIVVTCGDKEVIRWHGDPRRLSSRPDQIPANVSDADWNHLCLGSWEPPVTFRDLELRPLSNQEADQLLQSFTGIYPLTPQVDVPFAIVKNGANLTGQ